MKLKIQLLNSKLFGGRRWYQYFDFGYGYENLKFVGANGKYRTESFVRCLHSMEWSPDEKVVDVGSNAGRYCYEISKYVRKVVGIEYSKAFCRHANYLRKLYVKNGSNLDNVEILNCDIANSLEVFEGANTVFLSKVLYHKNLKGIGEEILKYISKNKVNRIFIQGHTTQGLMGEDKYVSELLVKYRYKSFSYDNHSEYPITIAYLK
jgi:hypothetical protein